VLLIVFHAVSNHEAPLWMHRHLCCWCAWCCWRGDTCPKIRESCFSSYEERETLARAKDAPRGHNAWKVKSLNSHPTPSALLLIPQESLSM